MAINNNGTIGGVTESASYTYDNYGRLVTSNQTSNGSSAQRRSAYDRWGNRSGVWDATSGGNQIQSVSLQTVSFPGTGSAATNRITSVTSGSTLNYSYDANGNVTNDGINSYFYDSENRLTKSVGGGVSTSYAYDHQNRRYKKTIGSSVTHYVWEGSRVVGEYNGSSGALLVQYGYAGSRMISKTGSGATQYFLSDRLSIRLVLSDAGVVAGRQWHLPFGEDFGESGTQEKHHFTSYDRDVESGTDYAVNRQYTQIVGRFNRVDPFSGSARTGAPQTWNRYSYTVNEPVNHTDPLGLELNPNYNPWDCSLWMGCNNSRDGWIPTDGNDEPRPVEAPIAPLPDNLRARLRKLLEKNNSECANFVHALIDQVAGDTGMAAYSVDALDLFDAINAQGGYVLEEAVVGGQKVAGTVRGALAGRDSPATVAISPQTSAGAPFNVNAVQNSYTEIALHETIHLANSQGIYSDTQLADAVFKLGGLSDELKSQYQDIKNYTDASRFWDKVLQQHCPQPSAYEP